MPTIETKPVNDADRVAYLIRIYRAARIANDTRLFRECASELKRYAVVVAQSMGANNDAK